MENIEILNELNQWLIIGNNGTLPLNHMHEPFITRNGIKVHIKNEAEFNYFIFTTYSELKINKLLISKNFFKNFIVDAYIHYKINNKICDIIEELQGIETQVFHVLLPIYYLQITSDYIDINSINFIKYQSIKKYLQDNNMIVSNDIVNDLSDQNFFNIPFIDNIVKARDYDFALEQAKIKLEEIIHLLNFIVYSYVRGAEVFSSSTNYNTVDRNFSFSENGYSTSISAHSPMVKRITIENIRDYLLTNGVKEGMLFTLMDSELTSEIEHRLHNAINWVGMAIAEKDNSVAFTQAMYGIESLLQYDQKGEVINKSIVANISESLAFLLGQNFEERKQLEKQFKDLYGIRSKIVHGKNSDISAYKVLDVIGLAKRLVMVFYDNSALKEAKTMLAVTNYITKLKYSYIEDKETK